MADAKKKAPPTPKKPPEGVADYLRTHLKMRIKRGHFTDPNNRTIELVLEDEVIDEVSFDVVQKREYEG